VVLANLYEQIRIPFCRIYLTQDKLLFKETLLSLKRLHTIRGCIVQKLTYTILLITFIVSGLAFVNIVPFGTVQASQIVNGIISQDTTWTKTNSPYMLTGPIAVIKGVTLTIEPGTIVNMNTFYIQVNGTLNARGSGSDPIHFNGLFTDFLHPVGNEHIDFGPSSNSWSEQADFGCSIENAILNYTTININNASPKISNNTIQRIFVNGGSPIITDNNIFDYIHAGNYGITIDGGSPMISNNEIAGIYVGGSSPEISNNTITSSGDFSRNYVAIYISGDDPVIVHNNIVSRIDSTQANLYEPSTNQIYPGILINSKNAVVTDNIIHGCLTGIEAENGLSIERNSIFNNTVGIMIDNKIMVQNNSIFNNKVGITLKSASASVIGNNIFDNSQNSIYLEGLSSNVDFSNNWWGTIDEQTINKTIHDFKNDFNLGKVAFVPFLIAANAQAMPSATSTGPLPTPQTPEFPSVIIIAILFLIVVVSTAVSTRKNRSFQKK
jgi:hypothetical protein